MKCVEGVPSAANILSLIWEQYENIAKPQCIVDIFTHRHIYDLEVNITDLSGNFLEIALDKAVQHMNGMVISKTATHSASICRMPSLHWTSHSFFTAL